MTWTYSGDPASSPRDEVRFLIGDTDASAPLLSDAEVDYALAQYPDPYGAAISCVRSLMAQAAKQAESTRKVGDLSLSVKGGSRQTQWEALLAQLQAEQFRRNGGVGVMAAAASQFTLGQMDNP